MKGKPSDKTVGSFYPYPIIIQKWTSNNPAVAAALLLACNC